ncbi:MAG: hypothetical protein HY263_03565 [Chloroflexi bacterium]|nr:hypothetical protein [Chloroflexota bacterium]
MRGAVARRAVLVALVLVSAVVAVAWTQEPLSPGNAAAVQGPPDQSPPPSGTGAIAVAFEANARVAYGTEVRNGLLPMTIDGLTVDQGGGLLTDLHLVLLRDPKLFDFADGSVRPFTPITLGPGETTTIGVVGRFVDCRTAVDHFSPSTSATLVELWLDVHVAGLPRVAHVPLQLPVELLAPETRTCPA